MTRTKPKPHTVTLMGNLCGATIATASRSASISVEWPTPPGRMPSFGETAAHIPVSLDVARDMGRFVGRSVRVTIEIEPE